MWLVVAKEFCSFARTHKWLEMKALINMLLGNNYAEFEKVLDRKYFM